MTLASSASLRITEIFSSLQGESTWAGERTGFIRLTGCPLRCVYCDSAYAFSGGEMMSLESILRRVDDFNVTYICVTGGEPLAQPDCLPLLARLCDQGYKVSLETSGALDISNVDTRVKCIVDLKTPSSGEVDKNRYDNINLLTLNDEVKFVIASRQDYEWALELTEQHSLGSKVASVLFSPAVAIGESFSDGLSPTELADWIIQDKLAVRFQMQVHKLLWGDQPGH